MEPWKNGERGDVVRKIICDKITCLETSVLQINTSYVKEFDVADWSSGQIFIPISEYNKTNPIIELYIKNDNSYSMVLGGYRITNSGVELLSDINYEGRVVIR